MVNGIVYDLQNITAADLAHIFWIIGGKRDGITEGCGLTFSGSNIYLSAGYFSARGHLTKLTGTTTVEAPTVSTGQLYCNLVYEIDLSQTPSESEFTQGEFKILQSATSYPAVTQEDLDNSGTLYQMSFAKFIVTSSGITSFSPNTDYYDTWASVSVPVSGWNSTWDNGRQWYQNISVADTTADKEPIWKLDRPATMTQDEGANLKAAYGCIDDIITYNGGITVVCIGDKPEMDVPLKLRGL